MDRGDVRSFFSFGGQPFQLSLSHMANCGLRARRMTVPTLCRQEFQHRIITLKVGNSDPRIYGIFKLSGRIVNLEQGFVNFRVVRIQFGGVQKLRDRLSVTSSVIEERSDKSAKYH